MLADQLISLHIRVSTNISVLENVLNRVIVG